MSKFKELYELSSRVIKSTDELFYFEYQHTDPNSTEYKETINKIKEQILEEDTFTNSMTIEEVDSSRSELIKILRENFEVTEDDDLNSFEGLEIYLKLLIDKCDRDELYDPDTLLRVFDRLKNQTHILCGESVSLKLKTNNVQIASYEISIYDAIVSAINIEIIKSMKSKIFNSVPTNEAEIKLKKDLEYNLRCLELTSLFGNFASEIQYLYADAVLDKLTPPNVDKLRNLGVIDQDTFIGFIYEETKGIADDLAEMTNLKDDPGTVFDFLRLVTSFEVFISHLDVTSMKEIQTYCSSLTREDNYPCMSGINSFVKARIKKKGNN